MFVDRAKSFRNCPRPGCVFVAQYEKRTKREINCKCGYRYCFTCGVTPHDPMPCDLAKRFMEIPDEATRILLAATTKECPKCHKLITKNKACNHMSCPCGFQFCWLCKEEWGNHGSDGSTYYNCKKYAKAQEKGVAINQEEADFAANQAFLQSYYVYRNSYDNHAKQAAMLTKLLAAVEKSPHPREAVQAIKECLECTIEAERILQWSFAMSYYLKGAGSRKEFFELQQTQLSQLCESVEALVEKKSVEELLPIQDVLRHHSGSIKRSATGTSDAMMSDVFLDILTAEAQQAKVWACVACGLSQDQTLRNCTRCGSCKKHGEAECHRPECQGG
jgi:ariadne-1